MLLKNGSIRCCSSLFFFFILFFSFLFLPLFSLLLSPSKIKECKLIWACVESDSMYRTVYITATLDRSRSAHSLILNTPSIVLPVDCITCIHIVILLMSFMATFIYLFLYLSITWLLLAFAFVAFAASLFVCSFAWALSIDHWWRLLFPWLVQCVRAPVVWRAQLDLLTVNKSTIRRPIDIFDVTTHHCQPKTFPFSFPIPSG